MSAPASSRERTLVFAVFLFGYTLSQFYRSFLAVIAPELARELGLSPADLGLVSGAWFAAFAVGQFPVGLALDRYGPRRSVALVMSSAVLGAVIFANAESALGCAVAMALIGFGCAPVYMGALYMFARAFAPAQFAFLASLLLAIGSIGNLLGASPLAFATEAVGWRATFYAMAALTALAAHLISRCIVDPARQSQSEADRGLASGLRAILAIRPLWRLMPLVAVSYAVVIAERSLWIGPYLADVHGLAAVPRGNAALVMALAMSAGALVIGALDRPLATRKWVVAPAVAMTSLGFAALAVWDEIPLGTAIALLAVIGFFGHTYGVLMAHGRAFLPDHLIGRGITLLNFLFIGGAFVAQVLTGRLLAAAGAVPSAMPAAYATMHVAFAIVLAAALVIYLTAEDRAP